MQQKCNLIVSEREGMLGKGLNEMIEQKCLYIMAALCKTVMYEGCGDYSITFLSCLNMQDRQV